MFLFPLPRSPPPRTAELELSLPSPATLGGGAKYRLFLALGEQSRLPGAERTRRGVTLTFFWKTALQESRRTKFQAPEHSSNQLSRPYILQELRTDKSLLHRDLKLSSLRKVDQGTAQD